MAIAKIIVDVPLMQTDQPYSYKIPEEFEGMLEVWYASSCAFWEGQSLDSRDCSWNGTRI